MWSISCKLEDLDRDLPDVELEKLNHQQWESLQFATVCVAFSCCIELATLCEAAACRRLRVDLRVSSVGRLMYISLHQT